MIKPVLKIDKPNKQRITILQKDLKNKKITGH